ncbi:hypothetical protein BX666DRAFT_1944045 [Dichotomocladium elegans]|nr:hypothetical protein BX666DRAFT_1944045 [Dichotomocladium elegans]
MGHVPYRINGIIIIAKDKNDNGQITRRLWLDDTTATICVLLSPRVCRRREAKDLKIGTSIFVFGSVLNEGGMPIVQCGGFHIIDDPLMEIHHSLKVMQANPIAPASTTIASSSSPETPAEHLREQDIAPNQPQMVFMGQHQTLLSQPSPNRGPIHHLAVQRSSSNDDFFDNDIDEEDGHWNWSPDHAFASSTPLSRLQQQSILESSQPAQSARGSPLRSEIYKNSGIKNEPVELDASNFGFDDSFDADDLDDIERNALQAIGNNTGKRPFDKVD